MTRAQAGIAMIFVTAGGLFLVMRVLRIEVLPQGGGTLYRYTRATGATAILPAGCSVTATILLATALRWPARAFALLPAVLSLMLLGAAYGLFTDRLVVGPNQLILPARGFPFRPHITLPYQSMKHVEIIAFEKSGDLRITRSDDTVVEIPLGELARRALPEIGAALRAHEIKFD